MLTTRTPDNIDQYSFNDLIKLLPDDGNPNLPRAANRMKLIRVIFGILGYDLSPDLALALCAEPQAQLVIATAGGGKTTGAQIKAILEKIWRKSTRNPERKITGDKILCLVYNKHNVKPMESKHKMLVNRLQMSNIADLNIDDQINASTMHSFCEQIRKENVAKMQLTGFKLQTEGESNTLMKLVRDRVLAKHNKNSRASVSDILSLYNYMHESLLEVDGLVETDKFQDIGLPLDILSEIFMLYDKLKVTKRKYDYVDMLVGVYNLLRKDPEALAKTQKYFEYIIADEIQDFTPVMMNILHLFVSNGTPLMCIGDEDQGIYNFRGADIYNTLDFSEKFTGGEVYSLLRNRRCRKKILDYAKTVISENKIRYHKVITGVKDGGNIDLQPYTSIEGENFKIASMLQKLSDDSLNDTVVCYRDRNSSIILSEILAEMNIPFHVISGYSAYTHPLYKDIISILNALESPLDRRLSLSLYKVLPIKKDKLYKIFKYDAAHHRFLDDNRQHFASYDFEDAMGISSFSETMNALKVLSSMIQSETMDKIFPTVWKLLCKYHWNFMKNDRANLSVYDSYIESRIDKVFNQHKTYKVIFDEIGAKMERCRRNDMTKNGVALSTFHGLKGLEYENCYLMDLDNRQFPAFSFIDNKPYSDHVKNGLKECETRLFYVAVTRAKDNLILFYNESNPSRYLSYLLNGSAPSSTSTDIIAEEMIQQNQDTIDSKEENIHVNAEVESEDSMFDLLDDFDDEEPAPVVSTVEDDMLDLLDDIDNEDVATNDSSIASNSSPDNEDLQKMDLGFESKASHAPERSSYLTRILSNFGG